MHRQLVDGHHVAVPTCNDQARVLDGALFHCLAHDFVYDEEQAFPPAPAEEVTAA